MSVAPGRIIQLTIDKPVAGGRMMARLDGQIVLVGGALPGIELSENVEATERVIHLETARPLEPRTLAAITTVEGLTDGPHVSDVIAIGDQAIRLRRHVLSFFQGNRFLLRDLVSHVV